MTQSNVVNLTSKGPARKFKLFKNSSNPRIIQLYEIIGTGDKVQGNEDFDLKKFKLTKFDCIIIHFYKKKFRNINCALFCG